jgi:hypothetical protein
MSEPSTRRRRGEGESNGEPVPEIVPDTRQIQLRSFLSNFDDLLLEKPTEFHFRVAFGIGTNARSGREETKASYTLRK